MDYNFFKAKKADSVPEGLREKYTFLPTFMPTMRRTSSRDDILKFYRYFDLVENNSGYLFTWKHYLNILKEQLREFDMIVYKSKTIISSMPSTASSETSVYTPNLEGNKNLIDESCTRRGTKTDINLKSEVSKEFVFSPDICNVKKLPSLEENTKQTFELLLGNESKSCPSASEIFLDEGLVFEETSAYSNSEENKTNPYDLYSKMNTNTELVTASIIEMVPSSSTNYNDAFEESHFEEKTANPNDSLIGYSEKDLEITSVVEKNLTQDVRDDTVLDCAPSKIQAYGFPVEYNFDTDHASKAGFRRSARFFSVVDLDMETKAEYITKSETEIITSSNARYNDVTAKSHLEEKPPNDDDYRINHSVNDLETASVAEKDLHQDVRYDAVSEIILSQIHADGLSEGYHFSIEPTPESEFKGSDLLFSDVNINMNTRTDLITKSTTEMVVSPDDSYNDANVKSHLEGRPSKADTDDSVNDLQITSVVENDLSHVFCDDAVLENVSPETPTEHPFSNEPTSDVKFTRATHSFPDDSLYINITSEIVSSPGVSYKDTVKKPASEGKRSKADACLTDNSVNISTTSEMLSSPSVSYKDTVKKPASEGKGSKADACLTDNCVNINTTSEMVSSPGVSYKDTVKKSTSEGKGSKADACLTDNSVNINITSEIVSSPGISYKDTVKKSASEGKGSKAYACLTDNSVNINITSEIVSSPGVSYKDTVKKPASEGKGPKADACLADNSVNINTTSEMVSSQGVSYKDTVKKSTSEGKGSKADACLTDNSENYLKILTSRDEDLSQNVSCSKISPSKTNAYELPMECHFINACASEVEYTIATISHPDGNFNRCTTSELNPESAKVISSSGASDNDAFEKSSLDGQRMNVDPGLFDDSVNDFETESAIDRDLSLDASCDQVSEKIRSKRDVSGLPVQYDSSITSESDAKGTTKASNFAPEIKHDEVVVKTSPKGKGTDSDETPLKTDTTIATTSCVTLGKGLDFSPDVSRKEISKRRSVSRISRAKVLKNVILDLKNVSKQIHRSIEKISSLSTCAKCGAPLQRICKSKTCLEPTENAGDMAIQLQTVSKIHKDMGSFQNNILLGDARKSPMDENVCSTFNTERGDENPLKTLI
ncbi:uncharacterized protein [Parasteatoda tepidariorum]|uniref:uncharacterized protein n=1 Tax=Parasteatoda tepidariorum TaxID=114398 RepID=UPI0039BC8414